MFGIFFEMTEMHAETSRGICVSQKRDVFKLFVDGFVIRSSPCVLTLVEQTLFLAKRSTHVPQHSANNCAYVEMSVVHSRPTCSAG